MKKLLSVLPLSFFLAACATSPSTMEAEVATNLEGKSLISENIEESVVAATPSSVTNFLFGHYECENGTSVEVEYSHDFEQATVKANVPQANWNNYTKVLIKTVTGSGERFVNAEDSSVTYEWQVKGDMGIISSSWINDKTYSVVCNLSL